MIDFGLAALGLVLGLVIGLTSVGTGVLGTPALILLFNISPIVAASVELFNGTIIKIVGFLKHASQKTVSYATVWPFVLTGVPASFLGAFSSKLLPAGVFKTILTLVLIFISLALLFALWNHRAKTFFKKILSSFNQNKTSVALASGASIGFLTSLTSIGSGSLMILVLTGIMQMQPALAVGTNLLIGVFFVGAGAASHVWFQTIDYSLAFNLLIGSLPGVLIGSSLSAKAPVKALRTFIGLVVFFAGLRLLL